MPSSAWVSRGVKTTAPSCEGAAAAASGPTRMAARRGGTLAPQSSAKSASRAEGPASSAAYPVACPPVRANNGGPATLARPVLLRSGPSATCPGWCPPHRAGGGHSNTEGHIRACQVRDHIAGGTARAAAHDAQPADGPAISGGGVGWGAGAGARCGTPVTVQWADQERWAGHGRGWSCRQGKRHASARTQW